MALKNHKVTNIRPSSSSVFDQLSVLIPPKIVYWVFSIQRFADISLDSKKDISEGAQDLHFEAVCGLFSELSFSFFEIEKRKNFLNETGSTVAI